MSDLQQLYQEVILDHHRAPRNARRVEDASHSAEGNNPLCGDRVRVTLRLEEVPDRVGSLQASISAVGCEVQGCALCRASGSIASELILGRGLGASAALIEGFLAALAAPATLDEPAAADPLDQLDPRALVSAEERGQLRPLLEVRHFPSRRRCSTLPWEALRDALRLSGSEPPRDR
jgi:nitrogen fixation NifU-like protein